MEFWFAVLTGLDSRVLCDLKLTCNSLLFNQVRAITLLLLDISGFKVDISEQENSKHKFRRPASTAGAYVRALC